MTPVHIYQSISFNSYRCLCLVTFLCYLCHFLIELLDVNSIQMHFRKDHFLCEDDACLAKKFVVFQSDAEIKVSLVEAIVLVVFKCITTRGHATGPMY